MYLRQHFLIRIIPIIMKTAAIRKSINRHETKHRNTIPNSSNAAAKAHLQLFLLFLMPSPPYGFPYMLHFIPQKKMCYIKNYRKPHKFPAPYTYIY